MRKVFAWVAGIAVTLAIWAGLAAIGDVLNIIILLILSVVIELAFKGFRGDAAHSIRWILEAGALFGVGWAMYQWWRIRTRNDG